MYTFIFSVPEKPHYLLWESWTGLLMAIKGLAFNLWPLIKAGGNHFSSILTQTCSHLTFLLHLFMLSLISSPFPTPLSLHLLFYAPTCRCSCRDEMQALLPEWQLTFHHGDVSNLTPFDSPTEPSIRQGHIYLLWLYPSDWCAADNWNGSAAVC